MGRGDIRSRKGKINAGSYGKKRLSAKNEKRKARAKVKK